MADLTLGALLQHHGLGDRIAFPFNTIRTIGDVPPEFKTHVTTLLLAHNEISKLDGLRQFRFLQRLSLSHNRIVSLDELRHIPDSVYALSLDGNPVDVLPGYRNAVILMQPNLRVLDNRPITEQERENAEHEKLLEHQFIPFLFQRQCECWMLQHMVDVVANNLELQMLGCVTRTSVSMDVSSPDDILHTFVKLDADHYRSAVGYLQRHADTAISPKQLSSVADSISPCKFFFDTVQFSESHEWHKSFFSSFSKKLKYHMSNYASDESKMIRRMDDVKQTIDLLQRLHKRLNVAVMECVSPSKRKPVFSHILKTAYSVNMDDVVRIQTRDALFFRAVQEAKGLKLLLVSEDPTAISRRALKATQSAIEIVKRRPKPQFSEILQTAVKKFYARRLRRVMNEVFDKWGLKCKCHMMGRKHILRKVMVAWKDAASLVKTDDHAVEQKVQKIANSGRMARAFQAWRKAWFVRRKALQRIQQRRKWTVLASVFAKWSLAAKWAAKSRELLQRASARLELQEMQMSKRQSEKKAEAQRVALLLDGDQQPVSEAVTGGSRNAAVPMATTKVSKVVGQVLGKPVKKVKMPVPQSTGASGGAKKRVTIGAR
jgi:hypothetical protein